MKDTSKIPEGHYCYVPDMEKNANRDENSGIYYTKNCPYYSSIEDEGVIIPYCKFIEEGGLENEITEKEFDRLHKKYGTSKNVWDKYPLDLLWDQVKECGENKYED